MTYQDDFETLIEDDDDEGFYIEEDDDDDDETTVLAEDDDDDDDELAERRIFRGIRRRRGVRFSRFRRSPKRRFGFRGRRSGFIQTRRGRARINLGKSLATTAEVKTAVNRLAADIRKNGTGIVRLDKAVRKVDSASRNAAKKQNNRLVKFEKGVNKKIKTAQQQAQQSALLPLLLQSKPELESITFEGEVPQPVASATYKSDSFSDILPILLLTSGGKGFGGDSSSGLNSILPFLLLRD